MLHLIFQSSFELSALQRLEKGDDVVFLENAVFRIIKNPLISAELQKLLINNIHSFVLSDELKVRGLAENEIVSSIEIIDYSQLVNLTEKNKVIQTWN